MIGVIDVNEPGYRSNFISPTLLYLSRALPEFRFRTVEIPAYQAAEIIQQTSPDFVIAPADIFLSLINSSGAQTPLKSSRISRASASSPRCLTRWAAGSRSWGK